MITGAGRRRAENPTCQWIRRRHSRKSLTPVPWPTDTHVYMAAARCAGIQLTDASPQCSGKEPEYVREWLEYEYPEYVKDAREKNARILFQDESGIQSRPNVRKTWSQREKATGLEGQGKEG